jgi:putative holliday junction resolvase
MRLLCLDVGDKKIGLALSDPTGSIALPLQVYRRESVEVDLKELKKVVDAYDVKRIVVGLPKNLNGQLGARAQSVVTFAATVEKAIGVATVLWDERFSTNEANRIFDMAQVSHKKRKSSVDMMASQIILQGYLDALTAQ